LESWTLEKDFAERGATRFERLVNPTRRVSDLYQERAGFDEGGKKRHKTLLRTLGTADFAGQNHNDTVQTVDLRLFAEHLWGEQPFSYSSNLMKPYADMSFTWIRQDNFSEFAV